MSVRPVFNAVRRAVLTFMFVTATAAVASPLRAQETCGWSAPPSTPRLPPDVETIIAALPANWSEAPEVIDKLNRWFHQCDDVAGHEAVWMMQRSIRRGKEDQALNALLGTALMHGPEVQIDHATGVTNRATYQLSNSERDGARLLAKAAASDPRLMVAARELGDVALATRHEPTVKLALETLRTLTLRTPSGPYSRLAAELALVARDYKLAQTYGATALSLGDSGAYHAIGIAKVLSGDSTGAREYLRGVSAPGAMELYYDDISYLLEADDTLAWQQTPEPARAEWIRKQWNWRASTSSQTLGDRLKLHFQRLAFAIDHYPRMAYRTPPGMNAVVMDKRNRLMTIDDRGLIYVRHGAPDEIIPARGGIRNADETRVAWGYKRLMSGRALFEFTKKDCPEPLMNATPAGAAGTRRAGQRVPVNSGSNRGSVPCANSGDYYLATPLGCTNRGEPAATYFDYATSIAGYDPARAAFALECYSDLIGPGGMSKDFKLMEAAQKSTAIINGGIALRTESASPQFTAPLDVAFMTYAMRNGATTQMFGFAGVAAAGVKPKAGTTDYALRVQLSVENNRTLSAESIDTTLSFHSSTLLQAGQVVRASVATAATPAGNATVRLTVRNANDAGQGQIITAARTIPDFSKNSLSLSDVVIAETRDGPWRRGDVRLAPVPAHVIAANQPFRLFYELYGAGNDDALDVQIIVAPGNDANVMSKLKSLVERKSAFQVAFTDRANVDATGTARVVREIGADLEPGHYIVTVRVKDTRLNTTAEAHTDLVIVKQ